MKKIDLTLPTPHENLALDEALLDFCEEARGGEILRFWEPRDYFAVLGYSNRFEREIRTPLVPVLRRISGGGTILQGPGCLNYSLILEIAGNVTETNRHVMGRHREAIEKILGQEVRVEGHTDLTIGGMKFSGNAQRRKRKFLLFHGTFLWNFDIPRIEKFLAMPDKEPAYRRKRPHGDFLMNLPLKTPVIKKALEKIWGADGDLKKIPLKDTDRLSREKYSQSSWNFKF
ncbi:MAG: lipoate--protein ligase family protein [Candidatus Omnitrophica bacterium]|nr:lipoate--protein ligase family protein [Candidatus Omnitrophota bacterium]